MKLERGRERKENKNENMMWEKEKNRHWMISHWKRNDDKKTNILTNENWNKNRTKTASNNNNKYLKTRQDCEWASKAE